MRRKSRGIESMGRVGFGTHSEKGAMTLDSVSPSVEKLDSIETSSPKPQPTSGCPNCGSGQPITPPQNTTPTRSYIYAIGRIEARFPSISIEKEFAQALGRAQTKGKTDREAFCQVLSDPDNLYLARQLCWVLRISDVDTYFVVPKYPADMKLLIEALRPSPDRGVLDAVIGTRGPMAPPEMCNGLTLPVVVFDHMYSFDRQSLLESIPKPEKGATNFAATTGEVWDRIVASIDNTGASEAHRALNYLAMRDPGIYACASDCYARDMALTAIETRPWRISSARKVAELLFVFTERKNQFIEKYAARVDVTDMFPFLVSKISRYYDH
jgi:hypothetical protein